MAYDAEDKINGGKGFDVVVATDRDIEDGDTGVTFDLQGKSHMRNVEAIVGTNGDDTLELNLNKIARQTQDVNEEDGNAFYALNIENLDLRLNGYTYDGVGQVEYNGGSDDGVDQADLDPTVQAKLGLDGVDGGELFVYTFSKGTETVTLYSDADWDGYLSGL